jgi:hypothetical protein
VSQAPVRIKNPYVPETEPPRAKPAQTVQAPLRIVNPYVTQPAVQTLDITTR